MKVNVFLVDSADAEAAEYAVGAAAGNDGCMKSVHLGHAYAEGILGIEDAQEVAVGHGQYATVGHDAVDVKGNIFSPKITLGKLRYADLYKPKRHGAAEKKALEIKSRVRKALEKNVR